jgi:hypothetical protein
MADDDDDLEDEDEEEDDPQKVVDALRRLRDGSEDISLSDVLTLVFANDDYDVQLVPQEAIDAVMSKYAMDRDIANGGLDQVAWNHGVENTRLYARSFRAFGTVENADLLDRLATSVEEYFATHGDAAITADLVHHFISWRKSMGGPYFGIPEPGHELAEPLIEFVLERASSLPDPDGPLPLKPRPEKPDEAQ